MPRPLSYPELLELFYPSDGSYASELEAPLRKALSHFPKKSDFTSYLRQITETETGSLKYSPEMGIRLVLEKAYRKMKSTNDTREIVKLNDLIQAFLAIAFEEFEYRFSDDDLKKLSEGLAIAAPTPPHVVEKTIKKANVTPPNHGGTAEEVKRLQARVIELEGTIVRNRDASHADRVKLVRDLTAERTRNQELIAQHAAALAALRAEMERKVAEAQASAEARFDAMKAGLEEQLWKSFADQYEKDVDTRVEERLAGAVKRALVPVERKLRRELGERNRAAIRDARDRAVAKELEKLGKRAPRKLIVREDQPAGAPPPDTAIERPSPADGSFTSSIPSRDGQGYAASIRPPTSDGEALTNIYDAWSKANQIARSEYGLSGLPQCMGAPVGPSIPWLDISQKNFQNIFSNGMGLLAAKPEVRQKDGISYALSHALQELSKCYGAYFALKAARVRESGQAARG